MYGRHNGDRCRGGVGHWTSADCRHRHSRLLVFQVGLCLSLSLSYVRYNAYYRRLPVSGVRLCT